MAKIHRSVREGEGREGNIFEHTIDLHSGNLSRRNILPQTELDDAEPIAVSCSGRME